MEINYKSPGPTISALLTSTAFVRGVRGPFGSGKSAACCMDVVMHACSQAPNKEGIRKTRWAIIRNTYSQLRDTTIRTWTDWFPEGQGGFTRIMMNPPPFIQWLRTQLPDGTLVEAEFLFVALDRPEDVKKLLSLDLTGGWINEGREVPKEIIDALTGRCGRFPSMREGGPSWSGIIMDTNSPDELHWWPIMAEDVTPPEHMTPEEIKALVKPDNWEFFVQPPAMLEIFDDRGNVTGYVVNPKAENINNLPLDYYPNMIAGKLPHWIKVYVLNRIGADHDGRKVHPHFRRTAHVTEVHIPPAPGISLIGGVDFGLTPACIFMQQVAGQWRFLKEIVLSSAGAEELADEIIRVMATHFPDFVLPRLMLWGDPSGDSRVGTDKRTPFQILRTRGLQARPTETNDPEIRRASLTNPMKRMVNGEPGLIISGPDCPILVSGLDGGWHYPIVRTPQGVTFGTEPLKNSYSHPCEAAEYGVQGGGEGRRARTGAEGMGRQGNGRVVQNPLERLSRKIPSVRPRLIRPPR